VRKEGRAISAASGPAKAYVGVGYLPPEHVLPIAHAVEAHGFDGVGFPEHIVNPLALSVRYPGSDGGVPPWDVQVTPWLEPLVALAAIAAAVPRLHLMTHIYILPARSPVHAAKAAGSLASLFPDRFEFGVGIGWLPDEYAVTDTEFSNRGKRLDEAIEVMEQLWRRDAVEFTGTYYQVKGVNMRPRPAVPPVVLLSGHSDAAYDRAGRLGAGFVAMPGTVDDHVDRIIPRLESALATHGRSLYGFHIAATPIAVESRADLEEWGRIGVTSVQVTAFDRPTATNAPLDEKLDMIASLAKRILS
jgi:probable F420-dependent oxidoreductase